MKLILLILVLVLALAGGATAGGPHLRELVERVGLLETADVDQAATIAEQTAAIAVLEHRLERERVRAHAGFKCLSLRIRALERDRRPPRLCSARGLPGPSW